MGGLSGCGLSSRRNFDCAPEGANFLQTGRVGLWPIGFRRMGRFSGRPLRGGVGAIPGLGGAISLDFAQGRLPAGSGQALHPKEEDLSAGSRALGYRARFRRAWVRGLPGPRRRGTGGTHIQLLDLLLPLPGPSAGPSVPRLGPPVETRAAGRRPDLGGPGFSGGASGSGLPLTGNSESSILKLLFTCHHRYFCGSGVSPDSVRLVGITAGRSKFSRRNPAPRKFASSRRALR